MVSNLETILNKDKEVTKRNNSDNVLHLIIPEEFERTIFIQNNIPEPPRAVPKRKAKEHKK
ncbi:MAG: hypothetical protein ACP5IB_09190 [Thermoplasmata archaeon]